MCNVDGQDITSPISAAGFDGTLNELKPFALTDTIEFIDALSFNLVMLVSGGQIPQWVCLYNLDSDEVVFEMPSPQPQLESTDGKQGSEDATI